MKNRKEFQIMQTHYKNDKLIFGPDSHLKKVIFWDKSDPNNIGPAYRLYDDGVEVDSGPLEFVGWWKDFKRIEVEGYNLHDYFDEDGKFLGPDEDGVCPVLIWIT